MKRIMIWKQFVFCIVSLKNRLSYFELISIYEILREVLYVFFKFDKENEK